MKNILFTLCAFVITVASLAPNVCRASWYQPEEPEGLDTFFKKAYNKDLF